MKSLSYFRIKNTLKVIFNCILTSCQNTRKSGCLLHLESQTLFSPSEIQNFSLQSHTFNNLPQEEISPTREQTLQRQC